MLAVAALSYFAAVISVAAFLTALEALNRAEQAQCDAYEAKRSAYVATCIAEQRRPG